jgi:tRNA-dihydrouridine synthase
MDISRADLAGPSTSRENNQVNLIPVSVKTRIGSSKPDADWWKFLADEELPAVAMHGRTFKQLYSGEADWEVLKQAAEIIKESGALFLGNGDVLSISVRGAQKSCSDPTSPCSRGPLARDFVGTSAPFELEVMLNGGKVIDLGTDFDGVLIGRAAIGNPWALRKDGYEPSVEEKLKAAIEHARVFEENLPGNKFEMMRKHLTWYAHGFEGAGGLRRKLVQTNSADEVEEIVTEFLDTANF